MPRGQVARVVGRGKPRVDPGDEVAVTDIPEKEEQRVCGLVQATIAKVVPGTGQALR